MEKLAHRVAGEVIDVLDERLAFERAGVRLCDRLLGETQATADGNVVRMPTPTDLIPGR